MLADGSPPALQWLCPAVVVLHWLVNFSSLSSNAVPGMISKPDLLFILGVQSLE